MKKVILMGCQNCTPKELVLPVHKRHKYSALLDAYYCGFCGTVSHDKIREAST